MFAHHSRHLAAASLLCLLSLLTAPAEAAITIGGDAGQVSPSQVSSWDYAFSNVYLGLAAGKTGTVTVDGGSQATCGFLYLGSAAGSSGSLLIDGAGSSFNCGIQPVIGQLGAGSVCVQNGASLITAFAFMGMNTGSSGTVTIAGAGSTWNNSTVISVGLDGSGTLTVRDGGVVTTNAIEASFADLSGNGTINTKGLMSDTDLIFDSTHGLSKSFAFGDGGTLNLTVDSTSSLGVGYHGAATFTVADGVKLSCTALALGGRAGSHGTAVLSAGSSLTTNALYVGQDGSGTLSVESGALVTVRSLRASLGDLAGGGVINAAGLVSDLDLVFDASHGKTQSFAFGDGGILNLNIDGTAGLGAGYKGKGTLRIADGVAISSSDGILGGNVGSSGSAVVTGPGSSWTMSSMNVGGDGQGALRIEKGGQVICTYLGNIGMHAGSTGVAVVTGTGSKWAMTGYGGVTVGSSSGTGRLVIGDGGKVTAPSIYVGTASAVDIRVSGNGMIVLGTATSAGTVSNPGKVNLYADAFLATGTYSPITACPGKTITWSGTGSYNGYGGTWNSTAHTFTVAAAATAASGTSSTLTTGERLLITDSATGKRVGASFGTVAAGTNFQADWIGGGSFAGIPDTQGIRGAWSFTTNFAGDQALLSYALGAGVGAGPSDLQVWRYNGTAWTSFAAPDLTYGDDGIANFAVTSFTRYAITIAKHPGDANDDGAVNVVDLGVLAKYYDTAAAATWAMADFSGDGAVNVVDLGVLAKNYDWVGTSAGAVPEPVSLSLLALGGLALLRRRR